jgi:tRNA (guanine37-N1)-methyltransferase
MKFHFHFVALFPEIFQLWLNTSILGRALKAELFDFTAYQLRDFSGDKHRSVDDVAYGGGGGMVLRLEPLVNAVEAIRNKVGQAQIIYFSPSGDRLSPKLLSEFFAEPSVQHLILICGHYEGVDQRFIDGWVDREISAGDFVVSGGELPALSFADALIRQIDGTLGCATGAKTESFSLNSLSGELLLEYPHYTRPPIFRGMSVPEILTRGDHKKIQGWREGQSLAKTRCRRPDLLTHSLRSEDIAF